ncbi:MAG: pro-sigmaK processing inhibitor BofA family protein [Firmicutes bacterium]|nr:pro-sigmaK processing inhibitor BofA family protein [Bacillota bacterium]
MEVHVVVAYVFGIVLLYLITRVLLVPVRILLRLVYNVLLGAALLVFVNFVGTHVLGIYLPVNPVTALVVGFLGIPGIILLVALQHLLL